MEIRYSDNAEGLTPAQLAGFFVGWEKVPPPETLLKVLNNSTYIELAFDGERVIGFASAISDKTLAAYIPLVEVLPEYQKRGIGRALVERLLKKLENIYMVDLLCDEEVEKFYEKFGFIRTSAMMLRHYDKQRGADI